MDIGVFLCRGSTILWSLGRVNEHAGEWAEHNGGGSRSFSRYAGPPFIATVKEATITKNKTKQTVSQIYNLLSLLLLSFYWGMVNRSVQWSVDQVRGRVHGTGVSVFGSPLEEFIYLFSKYMLSFYTMVLIKRSAALLMVIANNKNKIRIIKTCSAGLRKSLWIVPQ